MHKRKGIAERNFGPTSIFIPNMNISELENLQHKMWMPMPKQCQDHAWTGYYLMDLYKSNLSYDFESLAYTELYHITLA